MHTTLLLQDVLQTVHIKIFWQQCAPSEGQQVAQTEQVLTSSLQVMFTYSSALFLYSQLYKSLSKLLNLLCLDYL